MRIRGCEGRMERAISKAYVRKWAPSWLPNCVGLSENSIWRKERKSISPSVPIPLWSERFVPHPISQVLILQLIQAPLFVGERSWLGSGSANSLKVVQPTEAWTPACRESSVRPRGSKEMCLHCLLLQTATTSSTISGGSFQPVWL